MPRSACEALIHVAEDLAVVDHSARLEVRARIGPGCDDFDLRPDSKHLLQFAGAISVNLALINAFPIPALDGGRLLFLALESLRRKRLALSIESRMHQAGFFILLLLITLVTIRDLRIVFSGISP